MRLFAMQSLVMFLSLSALDICFAQDRSIKVGNPTEKPFQLYFKPEQAKKFLEPPLTLKSQEAVKLNLAAPGKYKTIIRVWTSQTKYVDSVIGWYDFHSAAFKSEEVQFKPLLRPEARTRQVNVTRTRTETRTDANGRNYTVTVPYTETQEQTYTVEVLSLEVILVLRDGSTVDGARFISEQP